MVWYGMVWYGVVHVVWCGACGVVHVVWCMWCGVVWCMWCGEVWCGVADQLRHDSLQLSLISSGNYLSMKTYTHKLGRFEQQNITNFCKKLVTKDLG